MAGENVVHKLGRLDLSWGTVLKLLLLAVLVFLLLAAGKAGAAKVQAMLAQGAGKVKTAVTGGTPATASDPRTAGL
jgi:hypothetical protein